MANKKTSDYDALPSGIVNNAWLLDIAQGSVKNYKGTALEFKDYVNDGKAGGKTIEGGTLTTQTLILRNNAIDNLGFDVEADGILHSNVTNYETLVTDDDDIPNKKYVDDHISNGIWIRDVPTTTITVKNAGDDIDFSTTGLIQSGTFDSSNISAYDSHPTFTLDPQIVDKKYVDDAVAAGSGITPEDLTTQLGAGGVTAFTLSATPVSPNKSILFYNGQQQIYGVNYTISGTALTWITTPPSFALGSDDGTNSFWVYYDITITPPGTLDQQQIYYVADAGNDTNNGKSVERPFLTNVVAMAAAVAQTPSAVNQFTIYVIGATNNSESFTIPAWCHLHAPQTRFTGTITMSADSSFTFDECVCPTGSHAVLVSGSGDRYIKGNKTTPTANSTFISTDTNPKIYAYINSMDAVATGAKNYAITTGTHLYLETFRFEETVSSTSDGASNVILKIYERVAAGYTDNINHAGDFIFRGLDSTGYVGFGGTASATYPRTKQKRFSGTLAAAGGFVSIPAATLGISTTFQIVKATVWGWYPTASAWIPNGNLWGEVINLRIVVGGLQIETPAASTAMAGQTFHLLYEYQQTDFLTP